MLKVHRVKPQVLQFLLDLVEDHQSEASTNRPTCQGSTLSDDDMTVNDDTVQSVTNGISVPDTAADQSGERSTSKTADCEGDCAEPCPRVTDQPETNCVSRDHPELSSKELMTSDDCARCCMRPEEKINGEEVNDCCVMTLNSETSGTSDHETIYSRCIAGTSGRLSKSSCQGCTKTDDGLDCACRQLETERDEQVRGLTVSDNQASSSGGCQTHEQCDQMDTSAQLNDSDVQEATTTLAKDVTWNTLVASESQNESLSSIDAPESTEPKEQSLASRRQLTDSRNGAVSPSCNGNAERPGAPSGRSLDCCVSRLLSNSLNTMLLHIGLECVSKFNQSQLSDDAHERLDSKTADMDEDEGPGVWTADEPRGTRPGNVEDSSTHDDQLEEERRRRLTCFYCLQRFADVQALQTHFEQTHCQQQQSPADVFHSRPDQHHQSVINATSVSVNSSTVSGPTTTSGVWDRLPNTPSSSYFGGLSPELLGLFSAVPPELMLPHLYPGGMLPPALMMMMLTSPFVGCPPSPLSSSLAGSDPHHASLLPSTTTDARATTSDDAVTTSDQQQSKRARTRIRDSQLAVLRARFDISGPPNDDEIIAIGSEIGLPSKVVKHWFRNTLFKERQRCKDSPYNFNVPPAADPAPAPSSSEKTDHTVAESALVGVDRRSATDDVRSDSSSTSLPVSDVKFCSSTSSSSSLARSSLSAAPYLSTAPPPSEAPCLPLGCYYGVPYPPAPQVLQLLPSTAPVSPATAGASQMSGMTGELAGRHPPSTTTATTQSRGGHGKRASRTHFSDDQVRTLNEHFERNAYPRDDELESLSRRLGLSARVIVVWFQNARQKARRTYENHSSATGGAGGTSKPDDMVGGPRYDCRSCGAAFQRYYELVKHQRSHTGCASVITAASPTKSHTDMAAARHDNVQPQYDKPLSTDAAVCSPSYRPHYNQHRRHQIQQAGVDAWYRPSMEGYAGAVSPRVSDVINALPVQRVLPPVFPPHLPLVAPWNSVAVGKEEPTSAGVDMTASRHRTDLSYSPVDTKRAAKLPVDRVVSPEFIARTADPTTSNRQYTDDTKDPALDKQSVKASCSYDDNKPLGSSLEHHHRTVASPTVPSSTPVNWSVEQQERQLFGGGELVSTSPRRRSVVPDDAPLTPQLTVGDEETPLDLSCQAKTTSSTGDSSSGTEDLKPVDPSSRSSADVSGSGTASKSHQHVSVSSKRHRTHMSDLQVRVMRAIYVHHRTPSIGECTTLGARIGLARRVVQVWFQNARAKDKKRCMTEGGTLDDSGAGDGMTTEDGRCRWCGTAFDVSRCSVREHVFSAEHVAAVDRIVRASTDAERRGGATGRAGKRDHRRRLLHRTVTLNSPAVTATESPSCSAARECVDSPSSYIIQ